MTKLDYTDFHKFIASLGVALIAFAGIFPWLFFKEPFDIYEQDLLFYISTKIASSRESSCFIPGTRDRFHRAYRHEFIKF